MEFKSKVIAVASGVALLGAGIFSGAQLFPVTHQVTITKEVSVPGPVQIKEVAATTIETIKEVKVDNGKLALVEQTIFDNDGNVNFLTKDLKDTEIAQIANRIVFMNDAKAIASNYARSNGPRELRRLPVTLKDNTTVTLYEADIHRFRIYDGSTDIKVLDSDFKMNDTDLLVAATFEQGNIQFNANFTVYVKGGQVDDFRVDSVSQR